MRAAGSTELVLVRRAAGPGALQAAVLMHDQIIIVRVAVVVVPVLHVGGLGGVIPETVVR